MIKIKSEILTYEFEHHINVIGGYNSLGDNSGTFKTALFEHIRVANNNNKQIECNLRLVLLDLTTSLYELRFDNNACYIIDELNFNPKEIDFLFKQLKRINGYAIIIGRMKVRQMQYAINAIYYLKSKVPPFILRPAFTGLEYNQNFF